MITRNNYEAYFLDYLENNLSPELLSELRAFLDAHPDLAAELEEMSDMPLMVASSESFLPDSFKQELVRDEKTHRAHYLIVAELEGDATPAEQKELRQLEKEHPFLSQEKALFAKTKLVADTSIRFFHKKALVQKEAVVISFRRVITIASAAAVAALIGLALFSNQPVGLTASTANRNLPTLKESANSSEAPLNTATPNDTNNSNSAPIPFEQIQRITSPRTENNTAQSSRELSNEPVKQNDLVSPLTRHEAEQFNTAELVKPDILPDMEQVVLPSATTQTAEVKAEEATYLTIWQFAENKAKEKIWGDESYPDQKFATAFAQREIQKRLGKSETKVEIIRENKVKEKSFRLKIGSLEINRKR